MRKMKSIQKQPFPMPDVVTKVVPAPTDGWDAISPLAVMDPKRAPILDNWVPRAGWVELRGGSTEWANLLTGAPVETLMTWKTQGAQKLFAASGGRIWDVSGYGTITPVVNGLFNNKWQYINFTPLLGTTVLQCCNGTDTLRQWNGTAWSAPSITGLPGAAPTSNIRNIFTTKRRIWYVLGNGFGAPSTIAAYMPTDAITGPIAGTQDLGGLWSKGGYLIAMCSLTLDGGNGPNDYTGFISSEGQVTLFSGDNPEVAGNWELAGGTFDLTPPIGARCATQLGADVALITRAGLLPLAQALPFDPSADRSVAITSRIQNAMTDATIRYSNNFGWEVTPFPAQDLLIMNIPITANFEQVQYVMNTLTGAWCRFTNWNANCFATYQNQLFWGGNNGNVELGYIGSSDNGEVIEGDMQCAYNYFEDPGRVKRMTMVQPLLTVTGSIGLTLGVDVDFTLSLLEPQSAISASQWDISFWDEATWSGTLQAFKGWLSTQAIGHAMAVHMQATSVVYTIDLSPYAGYPFIDSAGFDTFVMNSLPNVRVNAFNVIIEMGGFI